MLSQHHVIMRQQLEITVENNRDIADIQSTIEEVLHEFNQLLNHIFSQYVPQDVVITIDRLVVDNIVCERKKLKQQLIHKIHKKLLFILKKRINTIIQDPQKRHIIPLHHAKINALQHYLVYGTFAWWMTINTDKELEKIYGELLSQHPQVVQKFWFSSHHTMKVIERFVTRFSSSAIIATIKLLSNPSQSANNYEIIEKIIALQQDKQLPFFNQAVITQTIWRETLVHLVTTTNPENNIFDFTKTILKKVAILSHTSYVDVLQGIVTHYERGENKYTSTDKLHTIVKQLYAAIALPPQRIHHKPTITLIQQLHHDFSPFVLTQLLQRSYEPDVQEVLHKWLHEKKDKWLLEKNVSQRDITQLLQTLQPNIVTIFTLFNTLWQKIAVSLFYSVDKVHYIDHLTLRYIVENAKTNVTLSSSPYCAHIIQKLMRDHCALVNPLITLLQKERETLITTYKKEEIDDLIIFLTTRYENYTKYTNEKKNEHHHQMNQTICHIIPEKDILANQDMPQSDSLHVIDHVPDPVFAIQLLCRFLITDRLPIGYADPTDFIEKIITAVPQEICQKHITPLCRQLSIAAKIINYTSGNLRLFLRTMLIPFSESIVSSLQQILLKADILHATTVHEKEASIDAIFLQVVSKQKTMDVHQLFHQSLLYVGKETSLTQLELFRRIGIVVTQASFPALITNMIMEMSGFIAQVIPTTVDELDLAFIPTYDRLYNHLAAHIVPSYYALLLPTMKEAVRKRIKPISYKKKIIEIVYKHFPTRPFRDKQIIKEIIHDAIEKVTKERQKKIKKKWDIFLRKGILSDYKTAHQLFIDFIETRVSLPKNYFYTLLKVPSIRKRLVTSLQSKDLEKMITAHDQYDQYGSLNYIKIIDTLCKLWPHIKIQQINNQDFKIIFWDAALESLVEEHTVSMPLWLFKSAITAAHAMKISPTMLVSSFQIAMHNTADLNLSQDEITHMHNVFTMVQRKWYTTAEENAQKIWPNEPVLSNLHLLLTTDINSLSGDYLGMLTPLDYQLQCIAKTNASMLRKELLSHPQVDAIVRRLTYYFSDATIALIIEVLAQQFYPFVVYYNELITERSIVEKINVTSIDWKHHNNIVILSYLLQNVHFDKQTFMHHCIMSLPCDTSHLLHTLQQHYLSQDSCFIADHGLHNFIVTMDISNISKSNQGEQHASVEALYCVQESVDQTTNIKEAIRLYLPNAGVVLMWPFFEKLFEKQELMQEQQFRDDLSRHNAVHTLQYLTTGNLETPEWQLVLPKLLCGMCYNDITTKGYQPTLDELLSFEIKNLDQGQVSSEAYEITLLKKNCNLFITDAIQEWMRVESTKMHFSNMTIAQFREQFLIKEGILQYVEADREDGAYISQEPYWHLTIKMGLLDAVVELPPWPMGKIFLPWMKYQIMIFLVP